MIVRSLGFVALFTVAGAAYADSLDVNLNDDTLRLTYAKAIQSTYKGLELDAGWLYTEENDDSESLFHLGLQVSGENWSDAGTFDISVGGRAVYGSPGDYDLMAIGFGGDVRFSPIERVGFGANAYFAPSITSFMDAEGYREYGVRVDYQLLPQAFIYVGYRDIEIDIEDVGPDAEYDDEAHIGFKMLF